METQVEEQSARASPARVEVIDAEHARWPQVLEMIDRIGARQRLGIQADWLPARRALLVAFVGERAAGHLSFRLEPVIEQDAHQRRTRIEAHVDGCGVEDGFDPASIYNQLEAAARRQAADRQAQAFHTNGCADASI